MDVEAFGFVWAGCEEEVLRFGERPDIGVRWRLRWRLGWRLIMSDGVKAREMSLLCARKSERMIGIEEQSYLALAFFSWGIFRSLSQMLYTARSTLKMSPSIERTVSDGEL